MKRRIAVALVLLAASCSEPTGSPPTDYDVSPVETEMCESSYCLVGETKTATFVAVGDAGQTVPGARIALRVEQGSATLEDSLITTGADGRAVARVTFTGPGQVAVVGRPWRSGQEANGVLWQAYTDLPEIRFSRDSLTLPSPGCWVQKSNLLHVLVDGKPVHYEPTFSGLDTTIVHYFHFAGLPDWSFHAHRGGHTRLIASGRGSADTLELFAPPVELKSVDLMTNHGIGVGDTTSYEALVRMACGWVVAGAQPVLKNLRPEVLALDEETQTLTGLSLGTGLIAASYGALADTFGVAVPHYVLLPEDTVAAPGDSVQLSALVRWPWRAGYEPWVVKVPGTMSGNIRYLSSDPTIATALEGGVVVARKAGTVTVTAQLLDRHYYYVGIQRTAVLEVRSP